MTQLGNLLARGERALRLSNFFAGLILVVPASNAVNERPFTSVRCAKN